MNAAVIVAAGRGTRMGLERNKVLAPLCGEPVIARTVRAFERTGWFDGGIVVVTGRLRSLRNEADSRRRGAARAGRPRRRGQAGERMPRAGGDEPRGRNTSRFTTARARW